jgi:hypothetical protein
MVEKKKLLGAFVVRLTHEVQCAEYILEYFKYKINYTPCFETTRSRACL